MINYIKASVKRMSFDIFIHEKTNNLKLRKVIEFLLVPAGFIYLIILYLKNIYYEYISNNSYINELSVVSIVKDEGAYLEEWIEYHRLIGINKFYIYDNESDDQTFTILQPYIEKGIVTYIKIKGKVRQLDAYNDSLNKYGLNNKYLIYLDADEFIYCRDNLKNKINSLMVDRVACLKVNWLIFGSSGFEKKQNGFVTQNFIYRSEYDFEKNSHIKSICNPRRIIGFLNPHYPIILPKFKSINTKNHEVKGAFSAFSDKYFRINHYFTKSKEEFIKKKGRGMADNLKIRSLNDFKTHDRNEVLDQGMYKYKEKLEEIVRGCNSSSGR